MTKRKYIHPDTGDVLTLSENISWWVQGLIRNWYFVLIWTAMTITWWIKPQWFWDTPSYVKWMNLASWLAVTVELVIGIAMIGQTKRDAMIIRHQQAEIKRLIEYVIDISENNKRIMERVERVVDLEEHQIEILEDMEEHQTTLLEEMDE